MFTFNVTHSFENVSFDVKPFLHGPLIVSKSATDSESINAPQFFAVFDQGSYSLQLFNFGTDVAWSTNVTVNQIVSSFPDFGDDDDDVSGDARRLRLSGTAREGNDLTWIG